MVLILFSDFFGVLFAGGVCCFRNKILPNCFMFVLMMEKGIGGDFQ
jgi:hypothetical protein